MRYKLYLIQGILTYSVAAVAMSGDFYSL